MAIFCPNAVGAKGQYSWEFTQHTGHLRELISQFLQLLNLLYLLIDGGRLAWCLHSRPLGCVPCWCPWGPIIYIWWFAVDPLLLGEVTATLTPKAHKDPKNKEDSRPIRKHTAYLQVHFSSQSRRRFQHSKPDVCPCEPTVLPILQHIR